MKTFKEHIAEDKNILGPNWKKVTKTQHDKVLAQHDEIGPDLPGYPSKPGRIHANRFADGSIGHQRWSPKKPHVPSTYAIKHKDGSLTHWVKKAPINEMTDEEIDAHNDSFNDKVVAAHSKYIDKKYGKKVDVNFGAIHDEHGGHGQFTSKVYHPKHGKIYVTTHYDPKTHEVHKHTEE